MQIKSNDEIRRRRSIDNIPIIYQKQESHQKWAFLFWSKHDLNNMAPCLCLKSIWILNPLKRVRYVCGACSFSEIKKQILRARLLIDMIGNRGKELLSKLPKYGIRIFDNSLAKSIIFNRNIANNCTGYFSADKTLVPEMHGIQFHLMEKYFQLKQLLSPLLIYLF